METSFRCERCGSSDPRYIGYRSGKPYCRRCLSFTGTAVPYEAKKHRNVVLHLDYHLSAEQAALSSEIEKNYFNGIDTLVYAVCGAGKTELSYGVICAAMAAGLQVGFALPRRDVVTELFYRLKSAFPGSRVVAVYGGHTKYLKGDLIILTTHQLYRYENFFDLLVMDEIDAFPFKGDPTLIAMYHRSIRGHVVLMSATPTEALLKYFRKPGRAVVELRTRFHKKPIPVPSILIRPGFLKVFTVISLLRRYAKEKKPCFVFVPAIALAERLFKMVSPFAKGGAFVHSQCPDRPEIIARFKEGKLAYLITTAVLERGVTIKNLQVVIYESDAALYDQAALVQISGRAGRKKEFAYGEVTFLADEVTGAMESAIHEIRYCNSFL